MPFLFTYQIDGNRPKRKDGKRLIGPCKVTPNHVKTLFVAQTVEQQTDSSEKHRNTYIQTTTHGFLFHSEEVCHNKAGRAESGVTTRDRRGNHT